MKYLLLIYSSEANMAAASKKDTEQMHAAYGAYTEALAKSGVMVGGNRLRPTTSATSVRVANGKTNVLNGPYAETKEQLGGYSIVEVGSLDEAVAIARDHPLVRVGGHSIEIRPIRELPPR